MTMKNNELNLGDAAPINPDRVLDAIRTVRIARAGVLEFAIHDAVCAALQARGIAYRREYTFGPRCRADIWIDGIVIEIKKQRPARADILAQLSRYAEKPSVRVIIVVMERSITNLPTSLEGKPVYIISLNALWGIAL